MKNFLVHMRTTRYGIKHQTYHTIVAESLEGARHTAQFLAGMLPGTVVVISVKVV